jgi:hypothetical protein
MKPTDGSMEDSQSSCFSRYQPISLCSFRTSSKHSPTFLSISLPAALFSAPVPTVTSTSGTSAREPCPETHGPSTSRAFCRTSYGAPTKGRNCLPSRGSTASRTLTTTPSSWVRECKANEVTNSPFCLFFFNDMEGCFEPPDQERSTWSCGSVAGWLR